MPATYSLSEALIVSACEDMNSNTAPTTPYSVIDSVIAFFNPPATEVSTMPSADLLELLPPQATFTYFQYLPMEIRLRIYEKAFPPTPRDIYVTLIRDESDNSVSLRPRFKALNTLVPTILHICLEARECGLRTYKAAFYSMDVNDGIEHRVIYVNPLLDTIFFQIPSWMKSSDYARSPIASTSGSWTVATHTMTQISTFEWIPGSLFGSSSEYLGRAKNYLVIHPKSEADNWEGRLEVLTKFNTPQVPDLNGEVIAVSSSTTDREEIDMPTDWDSYWGGLVDSLGWDLMMMQPRGYRGDGFWDN